MYNRSTRMSSMRKATSKHGKCTVDASILIMWELARCVDVTPEAVSTRLRLEVTVA
jgi:hypothetical protein